MGCGASAGRCSVGSWGCVFIALQQHRWASEDKRVVEPRERRVITVPFPGDLASTGASVLDARFGVVRMSERSLTPDTMAITAQHRLEQRDKVLHAARTCFIQHGFHSTGMAEIAKACGMSVGNIYHYFPNKNAIVQAITDETRSRMAPVLRPLERHADPLEGLVQVILLSLRELCHDSNARLWMEILAEAPRNEPIREICLTFDRDLQDLLLRLMERAVQAGQLSPAVNLDATSIWLMALLDGAIARLSVQPDLDWSAILESLADNLRHIHCPAAVQA